MVFQSFPSSAWKFWCSSENCEIQPRKIKIILPYICIIFDGLCVANVYLAHCVSHIMSIESSKQHCEKGFSPFHRGSFLQGIKCQAQVLGFLKASTSLSYSVIWERRTAGNVSSAMQKQGQKGDFPRITQSKKKKQNCGKNSELWLLGLHFTHHVYSTYKTCYIVTAISILRLLLLLFLINYRNIGVPYVTKRSSLGLSQLLMYSNTITVPFYPHHAVKQEFSNVDTRSTPPKLDNK